MPSLSDLYSYAPSAEMAYLFPQTSAYRPDMPKPMARGTYDDPRQYMRHDMQYGAKGYGYLGPMRSASGEPMTEYSMATSQRPDLGNFPSVVPTLTREEMMYLLSQQDGMPQIPSKAAATDRSMYNKALYNAGLRKLLGVTPFFD